MPICILNVFYKLFTRVLAIRLMEVADDIISKNQTAFIKGMNILEGIMVLHKVIHEMR
jgi:mannose/fructose/N-acetylgalactosamine-specific phosphotransferase system component IIC